jgi:hypothetical protein
MNKLRLATLVIFAMSVFCASALTSTSGQTQDPDKKFDKKYWALTQKYCNDRFGFCVFYPASVGWRDQQGVWHQGNNGAAPENNDGSRFDNGNGLEVTVSGINNTSHDTVKSEMTSARKDFDRITYRAKGKNWFILKGQKADVVIFLKTYVGRGSINHLRIEVPFRLRKGYSQVVSDIAGSFRHGQLGVAH